MAGEDFPSGATRSRQPGRRSVTLEDQPGPGCSRVSPRKSAAMDAPPVRIVRLPAMRVAESDWTFGLYLPVESRAKPRASGKGPME